MPLKEQKLCLMSIEALRKKFRDEKWSNIKADFPQFAELPNLKRRLGK